MAWSSSVAQDDAPQTIKKCAARSAHPEIARFLPKAFFCDFHRRRHLAPPRLSSFRDLKARIQYCHCVFVRFPADSYAPALHWANFSFREARPVPSPAFNQDSPRTNVSPLENRKLPELDDSYVDICWNCRIVLTICLGQIRGIERW